MATASSTTDEMLDDVAGARRLLRLMLLIRRFEERTEEQYTRARIGGYCHLAIGEEAANVGAIDALGEGDYLFASYRDHGAALAVGSDPAAVMAELFGKRTGVAGGYGGSMHLLDVERHFLGGWGIVGGHLPIAVGAALALDYQEASGVVLCQLGDGATNIGAFHEALNLAAIWDLPIVFQIINNQYGMGTSVEQASAEPELWRRASAYRMHGERVDGNDVLAVREAASRLIDMARDERRPSLLETTTYRFRGHSVADAHVHGRAGHGGDRLGRNSLRHEGHARSAAEADVDAVGHQALLHPGIAGERRDLELEPELAESADLDADLDRRERPGKRHRLADPQLVRRRSACGRRGEKQRREQQDRQARRVMLHLVLPYPVFALCWSADYDPVAPDASMRPTSEASEAGHSALSARIDSIPGSWPGLLSRPSSALLLARKTWMRGTSPRTTMERTRMTIFRRNPMPPRASFRQALNRAVAERRLLVVPGAYDALSALLIERTGFDCMFIGGFPVAGARYGVPDIGLKGFSDIAAAVRDVIAASDVPVLVDIDDGYGDVKNAVHTVQAYERMGASAVFLEDQAWPKRCGHMAGKKVVPAEAMEAKIRATMAERSIPRR